LVEIQHKLITTKFAHSILLKSTPLEAPFFIITSPTSPGSRALGAQGVIDVVSINYWQATKPTKPHNVGKNAVNVVFSAVVV